MLVVLQLLRSLFILHINRQRTAPMDDVGDDNENDQELICRNISRLTFKLVAGVLEQVRHQMLVPFVSDF